MPLYLPLRQEYASPRVRDIRGMAHAAPVRAQIILRGWQLAATR